MNYLLDTHVFLWACFEPSKLSNKVVEIIENPKNILFLSSASIWEISIKMGIGKLKIISNDIDFKLFIEKSIQNLDLKELPVKKEHIFELHKLPYIHKDPFDRILIAQAISEGLILITNDSFIQSYEVNYIW